MSPTDNQTRTRDWYKISLDSLRGCASIGVVVALAAAGIWGWTVLRPRLLQRQAVLAIDEARALLAQVATESESEAYRDKAEAAQASLQLAEAHLSSRAFRNALKEARASRALATSILDALLHRRPLGDAQFISVQGGVEFRRGERGGWEQAGARAVLNSGDYVKTGGNGWAEIMFRDGTLYTVQRDTLFVVRRETTVPGAPEEQAIEMEYGWVNLSTSQRPSTISTPGAEAHVARESEGLVAYDQGQGRFVTYRGVMEVAAAGQASRQIRELQEVLVEDGELSRPRPIPSRPLLLAPDDNTEVERAAQDRLMLHWRPVPGAVRYALQISRNRLFVDNVIDVDDRNAAQATLGLRGDGSFVWRVAAYDVSGAVGPWSALRRFRVIGEAPPPLPAPDRGKGATAPAGGAAGEETAASAGRGRLQGG